MKLNILKKGFSLTELLIVLVVVAVLFSAMLPIMTKRGRGATKGNEPVWRFVGDVEQNAYTDKGLNGVNNGIFVGNSARPAMNDSWKPFSKFVIKTDKTNQNMLQFRYGPGNGVLAALFNIDSDGNILTTGKHKFTSGSFNTVYGNGVFTTVKKSSGNTAIGANSIKYGGNGGDGANAYNVSVGVNTNKNGKASKSVLLGANIASEDNVTITDSVVLGANNLVANSSMKNGVLIGNASVVEGIYGTGNIIVGSRYSGGTEDAKDNTLIGVGALEVGDNTKAQGMTSIGYNTCNTLAAPNGGAKYKTCIGYTSGSGYGNTQNMNWESDDAEHIFIGGVPMLSSMAGRAVLEVHNVKNDQLAKTGNLHPDGAKPNIAPTVVMNSNLVVRGNTYLTTTDGILRPMIFGMISEDESSYESERSSDHCGKGTCGLHRKWREDEGCHSIVGNIFATAFSIVFDVTFSIITLSPENIMKMMIDAFWPRGGARVKDFPSATIVEYTGEYECGNSTNNYPGSSDCPNLKLSDVRLKSDISENHDGIEKLLLVMPYNYTYKADKASKPQVGVIAQDLQKYFPNAVTEDEDGYLNIRWDEIFFATINSVKSLDETLGAVEKDVSDMENDVIKLANNHRSTKKRIDELNKRINKLEK